MYSHAVSNYITNSHACSMYITISVYDGAVYIRTICSKTLFRLFPHRFVASHWANGYYVHTIGGQKEQKVGYWFWLLYRLPVQPVPGVKPDDKFVVGTGQYKDKYKFQYLF